jgi:two-component system response regulator DesR
VIRILLVHGRTLIRGALAALLGQEADIEVVADVATLAEVVPMAERRQPDLVILDADLVDMDHLAALATLARALPNKGLLMLTDVKQSALLASTASREIPLVGFVSKQAPPVRLVEAVRQLSRGEPTVDPTLAVAALTGRGNPLTAREREVLVLAAAGAPAKEIAARLFLATGTVRNYLSSSMGKTGARTRIEAIRIAQDAGWL